MTAYQRDIMAVAARHPDLPIVQLSAYSRIDGKLDLHRIRRCTELVFLCNEALRMRLEFANGEQRQYISNDVPELEVHNSTAASDPTLACQEWMRVANGYHDVDCLTRKALLKPRYSTFSKSKYRSSEHLSPFQSHNRLTWRDWPRSTGQPPAAVGADTVCRGGRPGGDSLCRLGRPRRGRLRCRRGSR
ncbi:hypothetical protein [Nocardia abscessus]|uniref:hypothetical protein n=1 Tax=Nocardia abscessus TaxID=120957 RepID=UPI0024548D2C|nr:hypothetical protein [Nocardia abscessus]